MNTSSYVAAWESLRQTGFVAPELPSVVFVAVASSVGLGWGLGAACVVFAAVLLVRLRRGLPWRGLLGGAIGLVVTVSIARITGVAAQGLIADIAVDLALGTVLLGSVAFGRPLFGVLWTRIRRLPRATDPVVRRGYGATTGFAAAVLLVRGSALLGVLGAGEPVGWLLAVKIALGLPGTLAVIAACYAAGGLGQPAATILPD